MSPILARFTSIWNAETQRLLLESETLLKEAGKEQQLAGPYYVRKDQPHVQPPIGQYHLHVYKKQNELFSINWDGSGHDNSKGAVIPNVVYDAIKAKWPNIKLPDGRIIESFEPLNLKTMFKTATNANTLAGGFEGRSKAIVNFLAR